jgi:hypothetical protein
MYSTTTALVHEKILLNTLLTIQGSSNKTSMVREVIVSRHKKQQHERIRFVSDLSSSCGKFHCDLKKTLGYRTTRWSILQ